MPVWMIHVLVLVGITFALGWPLGQILYISGLVIYYGGPPLWQLIGWALKTAWAIIVGSPVLIGHIAGAFGQMLLLVGRLIRVVP